MAVVIYYQPYSSVNIEIHEDSMERACEELHTWNEKDAEAEEKRKLATGED